MIRYYVIDRDDELLVTCDSEGELGAHVSNIANFDRIRVIRGQMFTLEAETTIYLKEEK